MKSFFFLLILITSSKISAQVFGFGYQTTFHSNQFAFCFNIPYNGFEAKKENRPRIDCGIDYLSADKDIFSGLYLKPSTLVYDFNTFESKKVNSYFAISLEPAFLINNSKGTNGFTFSPNFQYENIILYIKAGYEFHFNDNLSQVYVRAGLAFGHGFAKAFKDTPISKE